MAIEPRVPGAFRYARDMQRWLAMLPMLLVVACEDKPFPTANLAIPEAMRVRHDDDARNLIVYDNNIVLQTDDYDDPDTRIAILEAHMEGEEYVATKLVRAWLDSGWETEPVPGTLRFTPEQLTIELEGRLASRWNGTYESRTVRERREREAREAERAQLGESETPVARSACEAYRDCTCALARLPARVGPNPFVDGCAEAESLLRTAADDPEACRTGLVLQRQLAPGLGFTLPPSCAD